MELFDAYIKDIQNLLAGKPAERFLYNKEKTWPTEKKSTLILSRDSAYELGGGDLPCVGLTAVTQDIPIENGTYLYGRDIGDITDDSPFAKLVLLKTKPFTDDEQTLFNTVKELEYLKYKLFIKGFMSRASAMNHREQIRVGKKEKNDGLSFEQIGNTLINAYLKFPCVESARIIFITTDKVDFDKLYTNAEKISSVEKALNHMLDNVIIDCKNCNLKPICDEVEGMRDLHLKMSK